MPNKSSPKFYLDMGTPDAARSYASLDSFTQGYIEAMFFTDASSADDGDLQDASFAELAPDALARIMADCAKFQDSNATLLQTAYAMRQGLVGEYDEERAGNDFWYTRNGHGTGFWDRGLGDVGDTLANAARHSTVDLYRGDDGLVYLA